MGGTVKGRARGGRSDAERRRRHSHAGSWERGERGRGTDLAMAVAGGAVFGGAGAVALAEAGDDVGAGLGVALDVDDGLAVGLFEEVGEAAIAVIALVERGLLALHGVFDHRGVEDFVILAAQGGAR